MKFPFFKKMPLPPLTIFEQTFIKEHPNYKCQYKSTRSVQIRIPT